MTVAVEGAAATRAYEGIVYYFCHAGCRERFDARRTGTSPTCRGDALPLIYDA